MSYSFIKMPENIVLDESTATDKYGRFEVQPLERGFGVTLGNSLRRVLLSSLTGAAVTAIKVDGVLHEFTTIPGIVEDVTQLVLNMKKIRLKVINKKATKLDLALTGPLEIKAEELQKACPDIEVLNPGQYLATLNDGHKLNMEIRFGFGKGYVPGNEQIIADQTIGIIPIDSIFSPITSVNYNVVNVRIGERNDYEKLILDISTDGSLTPEDALSNSANILKDHLKLFINFDAEPEVDKVESEKDAESERIKKILLTNVDDLELSVRSHNCLKAANIKTLGDLVGKDENEMLKFRNFGRKSLAELVEIVENYGLEFGMDVDKYINENNESN
ncbi:MAG: DNA-directed RNA polymerase subunit alpha [Ignavibacteria bacterium]